MASRDWPTERALNWTPRQREVLQLIAAGRTNAEIAEQLGVSLAGAKWHVSEVISKLGVRSREEAGAYWREANSVGARLGRGMSALLGLGTLKVVAGAAAAAVVVGVAAVGVGAMVGGGGGDGGVVVGAVASPTVEDAADYSLDLPSAGCPFESEGEGTLIASLDIPTGQLLLAGYRDAQDDLCLRLSGLGGLTNTPGAVSTSGSAWTEDRPSSCSYHLPGDPSVPGVLVCRIHPEVATVEIVADGTGTKLPAGLLPASLESRLKYVFTSFDSAAQSLLVRFLDEAGKAVNVQPVLPEVWPTPPMTDHLRGISPEHGGRVTKRFTTPVCLDANFEGLPQQGTWFHLYLDGEPVTGASTWFIETADVANEGRLCKLPEAELSAGLHTATAQVRNPQDPSAPAIETVTWAFEVAP